MIKFTKNLERVSNSSHKWVLYIGYSKNGIGYKFFTIDGDSRTLHSMRISKFYQYVPLFTKYQLDMKDTLVWQ